MLDLSVDAPRDHPAAGLDVAERCALSSRELPRSCTRSTPKDFIPKA